MVVLPWFGVGHTVMEAAFEPTFACASGWCRFYIDLPGTGDSLPVGPNSDAVLDAIEETIRSLIGLERFVVVGCSYGGYLAAGLARRIPERIPGLLLMCPGIRIGPDERDLSRVVPSEPTAGWLAEVPAELHDHFGNAIGNQTRAVASRLANAFSLNGPTDGSYLATIQSTGYQLSDEALPSIFDGNVTILAGTQDRIVGHLDQFDALTHYPHGNFIALGDAGHYLPFEQPEHFQALMLDWLTQNATAFPEEGTSG